MTAGARLEELIKQLADTRSPRRRAAAKRLRKEGDSSAVPALLTALEREVSDRRSWETQYHMIMALAECAQSVEPIAMYRHVLSLDLEPMVHLAASDAIVRASPDLNRDVIAALVSGSLPRAEGAIRALAIKQRVPSQPTIEAVLQFVGDPAHKQARFWAVAATPGWPRTIVGPFLERSLIADDADTRRAAQAALEGRYIEWKPL